MAGDTQVELGLALLDLADHHVDRVILESQRLVVDEQQLAVAAAGVDRVDVAGEPEGHDVDVGDTLVGTRLVLALHIQLTQRQVAVEAKVRLHQVHRDVHGPILPCPCLCVGALGRTPHFRFRVGNDL